MTRTKVLAACFAAVVFVGSGATLAAAAGPETPPPIDWRDLVDDMDEGDHVVGEELCALPGAVVPNSFVIT